MNRLSLDDFAINEINTDNEIEKMLGLAAAACHTTCNPDPNGVVDWVDHEAELQQLVEFDSSLTLRP
ncbi:hypothetical protein [Chitinophaga agri]|uniref:Uncharacterized protein n=1 Tax=Chitinophaga agri TaxID=2703787 RepID=A0A6B9ZD91_9BACT|nr:hypothetical protein [Chitinophaga agri]QHS58473.1 hypothetical protein GWR21_02345 [Chitinophaga agri]